MTNRGIRGCMSRSVFLLFFYLVLKVVIMVQLRQISFVVSLIYHFAVISSRVLRYDVMVDGTRELEVYLVGSAMAEVLCLVNRQSWCL